MTVTGDVAERASAAPSDPSRDGARAAGPRLGAMSDWAMRVPWLWPALLITILGWYQLGRPELWRDELASWTFATRPVPDLIATARRVDANHMVYYLLLHYWIAAFGDSAVAMRSLSVLAMAGAAACVTLVGRRLADTRAGLLAGLVFALVPSVSRFAQEMRSYAFEVLVATLATLMLLRAVDRPAVHRWAAYGVCLAALGYLDPVALAAVTGHAAVVAMRWWRDRDNRLFWFVPAALAGLAAWVPLALISWHEESGQVGWITAARPGPDGVLLLRQEPVLLDLRGYGVHPARHPGLGGGPAARRVRDGPRGRAGGRGMAGIARPASFFFPRYLLPTVAAWAMLAGIGLARVDGRAAAAVVLTLALLGAGDQQVIRSPGAHNWTYYPVGSGVTYPDFAGAAAIIAREAKAGDGIVYPSGGQEWQMINLGVQYYLERDLGHGALPQQLFLAGAAVQLQHLYPVFCNDPAACLGDAPRTWVVVSGDTSNPYGELISAQAAALRSNYRLSHRQHVPGLTVFLLVRS